MNGRKTGQAALKPRRRASTKWPSSWTKISSDEPDPEPPAPDQRVAADRDEDRRELREREAELDDQPDHDGDRRPDLARERAPGRLRVDRPVVALGISGGKSTHYGIGTGRPSASSSGPEKTQSTWIVASLSPP